MIVTITRALIKDLLTQATVTTPAPGKAFGGKVILWTGTPVNPLSLDTVLEDLTLCTFTGYAASASIVWALPGFDETIPAGKVYGDAKLFKMSAEDSTGQQVAGWAVVDTTAATVLVCCQLDATIPIIHLDDQASVVPFMPISGVQIDQ
jgi:hypothetical protein